MQVSHGIYFLAFSLEIGFFQAYTNGAKDSLSLILVAQEGERTSMKPEIVDAIPVLNFIFALGPNLTHVKLHWTQVWLVEKVTRISLWFSNDEELHLYWPCTETHLELIYSYLIVRLAIFSVGPLAAEQNFQTLESFPIRPYRKRSVQTIQNYTTQLSRP